MPVAIGVVVRLGAALMATRSLASLLYRIQPGDPATLASASVVLLLVAVAASVGPAARACQADPMQALRAN